MPADDAQRLLGALRRVSGAFTALGYEFGERHGLSRSDVAALVVLTEAAEAGATIGTVELARRIGVTAPSATVLVDRLVAAGLLARHRHSADRRRVVLSLTSTAQAAGRDHFGAMTHQLQQMLAEQPVDDLRVAADLLERVADRATASAEPARPAPRSRRR